ncbi:MAG: hypothetical protein ABSH56_15070 [Bryobacteraceae bacterium]|jgi:hypothetical protein
MDGRKSAVHPSNFQDEERQTWPVQSARIWLMARTSTVLNPDVTLEGCNLLDALRSTFSVLAEALRARGVVNSRELFRLEIPALVFEVAAGAGWIPFADSSVPIGTGAGQVVWEADWHVTDKTVPDTSALPQWLQDHLEKLKKQPSHRTSYTKYQVARLVQVGDLIVERRYMESFYALLEDWIDLYLDEVTEHEKHVKLLPKRTTAKQRDAFLQDYIAKEKAKGIKTTKKKVADDADVQYTLLAAWAKKRKPMMSDATPACQRIMLLIMFGERSQARHYRQIPA